MRIKMRIDFHIHSLHSHDAISTPKSIVESALRKGLGAIAITDHDSARGWKELDTLGKKANLLIIQGEELKLFEGKKFVGELMGLFLTEGIKSREYLEAIDEIHSQGALVGVPHPFDVFRNEFKRLEEAVELKKIDAIESINARCFREWFNAKAKAFAEKNSLPQIAGSDAHFPEEIGSAYTEVKADSLEDIKRMIKKNSTNVFGRKSSIKFHLKTFFAKNNLIKEKEY
ncbi:PHP domain-containing protein [Candidatus Micrarchaeota archaeon]|nr:PHP domain-containing protein [Candidatus Micrarchaeota archaeon]